ncbi:MAG: efflux RND transporter permease subunit, partial [Geminicoccaceae bacterium]|nr:efflux RND transporter permease subunit [Geminicoccaceae bacterium]
MHALIETAFERSRTVLLVLLLILVAGSFTYVGIPKEADPDVQIPIVYISVHQDGIAPEDADRLLVRPIETELQGLEGVKEIRSWGREDGGSVLIEFDAGTDIDEAIADVRDKVDRAKPDLPAAADEPSVNEVNLALMPVLVVTLSGDLPERALLAAARDLRDRIEALPSVLEVDIAGEREEVIEVEIDPLKVQSYGLELESIVRIVDRNNQIVAAGALDTGSGRFAIKAPGVFEDGADLLALPLKAEDGRVVRLGDIATVRRTFKDATGFARVDGRPTLALEIKKRIGTNIIETTEAVKALVASVQPQWPAGLEVGFSQDKSDDIRAMLSDLQNNVLSAIILVMIVIVAAMGLRSAMLVGFAVPGSFLAGIMVIGVAGLTVNIVVLFGLILAVGMLVDGAIVVTELADRKMAEGLDRKQAYRVAAHRMAWPITASTATTLAAFMPLLFWPGVVGEFMKFLPITLVATLSASLAMALVFVPCLGALFGKAEAADPATMKALAADSEADPRAIPGFTGAYVRLLDRALRRPGAVALLALAIAFVSIFAYGAFGRGVEFFPDVEPEVAQLHVHARGDLSVVERDALVRAVEERVIGIDGIDRVYARTGVNLEGDELDADTIGTLLIELDDWDRRRPAAAIMAEAKERTAELAGIHVEERKVRAGPPVGKPVTLEIRSVHPDRLEAVVEAVRAKFEEVDGLIEITDSRPIPGIEWQMDIDREMAARFGTDLATAGATVQLVTNGLMLGTSRPDDAEDELDIRARFPADQRHLDQLDRLIVNTAMGSVPLSNFIERRAVPKVSELERVDGKRVFTVAADVAEGVLVADEVAELRGWLDRQYATGAIDPSVEVVFKGEDEEQKAAEEFLSKAFGVALFLIAIILVTQFNSFYQAFLILSAILFSTVGVLLGLLITDQPFGIVMSGVGVIALAGIVVNNNIVLIDTYDRLREEGWDKLDAVLQTCRERARP